MWVTRPLLAHINMPFLWFYKLFPSTIITKFSYTEPIAMAVVHYLYYQAPSDITLLPRSSENFVGFYSLFSFN